MSIRKQGFRHSVVNYVGVAMSFLSTLFIYNLDIELYGLAQFLTNTANFLIPFMSLGVVGLVLKYYPQYGVQAQGKSFIKSIFSLYALSTIVFLFAYAVFRQYFVDFMQYARVDRQGILEQYFDYVIVLGIVLGVNRILTIHSSNLRRIVVPEVINNIGYKIALPVFILLGYWGWITDDQITWMIMAFFLLVGSSLFIYVYNLDGFNGGLWKWSEIDKEGKKEIKIFTFYSALNGVGASFAFRVDMIMLSTMLGFTSNGVYALLLFLSNVIDIPRKSLSKIISPFLSTAAANEDHGLIEKLYQKASITLLVPSVFLTLLIWSLLPELDKIATGNPVFYKNRYLFLFLAIGRLVNMLFSTNTEIIRYSKFFKYNLPFIVVLAVTNVTLNYFLINEYQILGAAMATLTAFLAYNILKSGFIYFKMSILPFHKNTMTLLLITGISAIALMLIPKSLSLILAAPLKGVLLLLLYVLPAYLLKLSPDLNELGEGFVKKLLKRT